MTRRCERLKLDKALGFVHIRRVNRPIDRSWIRVIAPSGGPNQVTVARPSE
jgi:hypothetical protein